MKTLKNVAFSALLCIGAFTTVTYVACNSDKCKDTVCQNGGICADGNCSCSTGYEGTLCETKVNAKYVGTYTAVETPSGGGSAGSPYIVTITADPTNPTYVLVNNLGNYGCTTGGSITFNGTTNSTTLTINDNQCGYQMNATMTYNLTSGTTTLSGSYTAIYLTTTDNYNVVLTR